MIRCFEIFGFILSPAIFVAAVGAADTSVLENIRPLTLQLK